MSPVPFVDLKAQYSAIRLEIDAAIQETIDDTAFIMGARVKNFEEAFAHFCGARFAVGTSSGTTALHLALLGCGVGPGDEVITVSHTFIATGEAICHCGATPVFVDVEPDYYTIDPSHLEEAISAKTKAVIVVHLYGQCCDMDAISVIARDRGLKVIEDAAQAHGAGYKGRSAGTLGDVAAFSFFPGKNLGAYGDAGMVVTDDERMAEQIRLLVNHGRATKYEHQLIGYNYRQDALQAAILNAKLPHLDEWVDARRQRACRYNELLEGTGVATPKEREKHAYHLYVIQAEDRDHLRRTLQDNGIATGIHYPIPLHLQPCFADLPTAGRGRCPVTESLVGRILSLPMYPELNEEQQDEVVDAIRSFLDQGNRV